MYLSVRGLNKQRKCGVILSPPRAEVVGSTYYHQQESRQVF